MSEPDTPLVQLTDIPVALGLLSRLPVPVNSEGAAMRGAAAAWAFPLAGLVIALLAGLVGSLASGFGLSPGLTAALVLVSLVMMTGAMHEDGLADTADGFWGGWDVARRLEIMKDSHIGAYGVIALVLSLLARWTALSALIDNGTLMAPLLATAALSRAPIVGVMAWLANARAGGLSARIGRVDTKTAQLAFAVALVCGLIFAGLTGLIAAFWAALAALGMALLAKRKIGGQTGDVLGATQQVAEIAVLATLVSGLG